MKTELFVHANIWAALSRPQMEDGQLSARDISSLAFALCRLHLAAPPQWVAAMLRGAARAAGGATGDDLALILDAVPSLLPRPSASWLDAQKGAYGALAAVLQRLVSLPKGAQGAMRPEALQRAVSGVARVGWYPGAAFLDAHRAACEARLSEFTESQRRRVVLSYKRLTRVAEAEAAVAEATAVAHARGSVMRGAGAVAAVVRRRNAPGAAAGARADGAGVGAP